MLKHEAKLIDPDAEQIVAALTEATAAANKRCRARLLADDPAKWRKFTRDAAAKPEGYAMFRGGKGGVPATQVLAAWWTDAAGRKHVVIRGRRVEHDEAQRLLQKADLDARPPLWHAYPEYVCRRTIGPESQIVCACGCGAVGTPESLGWMGETCGPCFDRQQDVGPVGLSANLPGVLYGNRDPLGAVTCSPDGNRVAAKEGDSRVTYWDIATRTRTVMKFSDVSLFDVAISSDGRRLLVVGVRLFAAFDLDTDPPTRIESALEHDPPALRVVPIPDPQFALLLTLYGDPWQAELVRVPSGQIVRATDMPAMINQFAVSPDGKRFAAGGEVVTVFDREAMAPLWDRPSRYFGLAFSHDNKRVIAANTFNLVALDATTGRTLIEGGGLKGAVARELITSLAVDPGGAWVYASTFRGKVLAFAADALELRAAFEWHLGVVRHLAVSADGSRLFSSGGDGCVKVWPIRDLLRGVNGPT